MQQKTQHKRKKETVAVNSRLIRRPIQRCFAIFLLPTFAAFCIGFLWPFVKGLYLSFCTFTTTSNAKWVGLQNYQKALTDASFLHAFWYTALVAIVSLILINVLSFAVAYALTRKIPGANIYRGVFFMPNLIGGIVLGYIWQLIINGVLARWGADITMNAKYGFWGLVVLMNWQLVGYMMIIYIAAIQNIPPELREAARIDGAGAAAVLRHVTIPMAAPAITICTFLTLTNSFKLFDQNLALTRGAPQKQTAMLALDIYNTFYGRTGYEGVGQAKAVVFFLIVAAIAWVQLRFTRTQEVES